MALFYRGETWTKKILSRIIDSALIELATNKYWKMQQKERVRENPSETQARIPKARNTHSKYDLKQLVLQRNIDG